MEKNVSRKTVIDELVRNSLMLFKAEILVKDQAAYDFIKARSSRPNPVIYNPNP